MFNKYLMLPLTVWFFCVSLHANQSSNSNAAISTSSQYEIGEHFKAVKVQIDHRWNAFQNNRLFKPFEIGKSDAVLQRVHSVAKFGQYITLHRLAEIYLNRNVQ